MNFRIISVIIEEKANQIIRELECEGDQKKQPFSQIFSKLALMNMVKAIYSLE